MPPSPSASQSVETAILETDGLVKRFGGLTAVNGLSLRVEQGEILGLLGPNGAGKSVFLACIAGALRPDAGRVLLAGNDTTNWSPERKCRAGLGRTFQIPHAFPKLSALENVLVAARFGAPRHSAGDPVAAAHECLSVVGFRRSPETQAATLNAVELKLLDLARAVASQPRVLLLDELAAGLMTGQLGELMEVIRRIRDRGITIVMVEHVMQTILGLCERLVVLHHGEMIALGPTREVAADPKVVEAYFGEAATA